MRRQSFFIMLSLLLAFGGLLVMSSFLQTAHGKVSRQGACTLSYDKSASPTNVAAGGATTITFALQSIGDCTAVNSPADVILVLDRSNSMTGQPLTDAKAAAISFVEQMNLMFDQVGVASFSHSAMLESPLSQDSASVTNAINDLLPSGATNMIAGLQVAETELITSGHHIASNAPVIIFLSDGHHSHGGTLEELYQTAARIKAQGIRIISIGLGNIDEAQLRTLASSDDDYYYAPDSSDLYDIYQSLALNVRVAARDMILTDTLSIYSTLIPGSLQGPILPTVNGNQIIWEISAVSTNSLTLSYQATMTSSMGTWPTNESAIATYINAGGNLDSITFPMPEVTVDSGCGSATLNQANPIWSCQGTDIDVQLFGSGFFEPLAEVGDQQLSLDTIEPDYLQGTLKAGVKAGRYDATVINSCQSTATLANALTIYAPPEVLSVHPSAGYSDFPSTLTVCGTDFTPGTILSIEMLTDTIPLENQAPYGNQCIVGTLPQNLAAGDYPILVDGACGSASGLYTVLTSGLNDDLWAESHRLWMAGDEPAQAPHLNEEIDIGLIVNRRGGRNPVSVTVDFYEGNPNSAASVEIGQGTIPLISPNIEPNERIDGSSTSPVPWEPSQGAGEYTLYAIIDPANEVTEDIENNNVISRTVLVLAGTPGVDQLAPRVDVLRINDTISTTTLYEAEVDLHVESQDTPQSNVPASGVTQMLFVEYIFHQSSYNWVPVQDSGWLPFSEESTWALHPEAGLRFIQAWTVDDVGNISRYANQKSVNYIPPSSSIPIFRHERHIYREELEAGEILDVVVAPSSGDADLYIWPPNTEQGKPPWVSDEPGNATEFLTATVPTSGEYQIEVRGYTNAEYNITIEVLPAQTQQITLPGLVIEHRNGGKPIPQAPTMPTNSAPNNQVMAADPPEIKASPTETFNLYLPAITR